MSSGRRTQRMASLIRGELARVLIEEVSDPSLKEIVITEVELSGDFKHAKVFFSRMLDFTPKEEKEVSRGFHRAEPFFKRRIGEHLQLRFVPTLEFQRDLHGDSVNRLMHLFEDVSSLEGHKE